MLILVIGGSGSGKSEYAERRVLKLAAGEQRYYVATMEPFGEEGKKRIERHRKMRAGKGFVTVECAVRLERLRLPAAGAVLIEDLSNLLSNEIWSADGRGLSQDLPRQLCQGIEGLAAAHRLVVVVSNDVHRDGGTPGADMERFLSLLGACNARLAALADEVTEVVCGIPLRIK